MAITQNPYSGYSWNAPMWSQRQAPIFSQQQSNTFDWIRGGEVAVNAYQVQPGNTVRLMDADNPVLYVKTVDFTGKPLVEIYDLVLRQNKPEQEPSSEFVTKTDLQAIIADTVRKELNRATKQNSKSPRKEVANG